MVRTFRDKIALISCILRLDKWTVFFSIKITIKTTKITTKFILVKRITIISANFLYLNEDETVLIKHTILFNRLLAVKLGKSINLLKKVSIFLFNSSGFNQLA